MTIIAKRSTLADVIAAHRRFGMQCTCGWAAPDIRRTFGDQHDPHVADAVREHILGLLANEALVEALTQRLECDHEREIWREYEYASHCAPCDLVLIAEAVRDDR